MIKIQLSRSGGQMGKELQASGLFDLEEEDVISQLKEVTPVKNPQDRDALYDTVVINDGRSFSIDVNKLKGKLKKIVLGLEPQLKVGDK